MSDTKFRVRRVLLGNNAAVSVAEHFDDKG
jgi:hypothetical protein